MVKFLKHQVKAIESQNIITHHEKVILEVVQQPVKARVSGRKETRNSSRRLVDPQPIVQLKLQGNNGRDIIDYSLGMYFIRASIECVGFNDADDFMAKQRKSRIQENINEEFDVLRGTTTITAQFYKESPYAACGVFDNLSVRFKGDYRLKFDLFEVRSFDKNGSVFGKPKIIHWANATVYSSKFTVYTDASFDGLEASPVLNEQLKKAGCRIRTRKPRSQSLINSNNNNNNLPYNDFKVSKPIFSNGNTNGLQFFQNISHQLTNSPSYVSPMPSRSSTPAQRQQSIIDIYSRSSTPSDNLLATPNINTNVSSYFTPQAHHQTDIFSTPQTSNDVFSTPQTSNDVFSTPMTYNPAMFEESQIDLSPLEQDASIFNALNENNNSNNNYVLGNHNNGSRLDFNNLNNFYKSITNDDAPRAQNSDPLLEPFDSNNNSQYSEQLNSSNMELLSLLQDNYSLPKQQTEQSSQSSYNQSQEISHQQIFENPFAINDLEFSF